MSRTIPNDPVDPAKLPQIVEHLNGLVANTYGLMAQLHLAHWNVEGSDFFQLHEALEEQYKELFEGVDDLAERVRALGHYSVGGIKRMAEMSQVPEGPAEAKVSAKEFVGSVLAGHEKLLELGFAAREIAAEAGDAETEDLIIARNQEHQKAAWMLRSYLGG